MPLRRYAMNCGLLLLPILAWNAALAPRLPAPWTADIFWRNIPPALGIIENTTRIVVLAVPFFMPLELKSRVQWRGLILFGAGLILYAASWLLILVAPGSPWSSSAWISLAPAYTPLIWLSGVALLGQRLFWGSWYRWWMYLIVVAAFIAAHVLHAMLIYARLP